MKRIRIFFRSIRDAFKNVSRNFSLSMASILCTTITLIIVSISILLAVNITNSTNAIKDELSIVAYFSKEITQDEIDGVLDEIKIIDNVRDVIFISKDEQKINMSSYSSTFETILNYLDENPLLDSMIIYVKDVKELTTIADEVLEIPGVETAKYGEGMIEEVISALDIIEKVAIGIVISLVLVTIFLITNTIKLTIYSRKREIEIMRLVGASNFAIKLPFVVEGLIIGAIGAIIPICITIYGYVILYNVMHGYLFSEMLQLVKPYNFVFWVSLILLLIGSLVGAYGSLKATRKHLKI